MTYLRIRDAENLPNLDLSNNTFLTQFYFGFDVGNGGIISSIDISNNININDMGIGGAAQLTECNIQNGNNQSFPTNGGPRILSCPNLTCVQVDDANYSSSNWILGSGFNDPQLVWSENCP